MNEIREARAAHALRSRGNLALQMGSPERGEKARRRCLAEELRQYARERREGVAHFRSRDAIAVRKRRRERSAELEL